MKQYTREQVIERLKAGAETVDYNDPNASAVVDKFIESSDYEFECTEIVGRKFEDIADHADYIRNGGCSQIIEALVS